MALELDGRLTATQAKTVLAEMVATGADAEAIAEAHGFEAMDTADLAAVVDEIIAANPDDWDSYVHGDDKRRKKVSGAFIGKIMKATQGQADGRVATQLLEQRRAQA